MSCLYAYPGTRIYPGTRYPGTQPGLSAEKIHTTLLQLERRGGILQQETSLQRDDFDDDERDNGFFSS